MSSSDQQENGNGNAKINFIEDPASEFTIGLHEDKPLLLEDARFLSARTFGQTKIVYRNLDLNRLMLPGTNWELLKGGKTQDILSFHVRRELLRVFFDTYTYYLTVRKFFRFLRDWVSVLFWSFITTLNLFPTSANKVIKSISPRGSTSNLRPAASRFYQFGQGNSHNSNTNYSITSYLSATASNRFALLFGKKSQSWIDYLINLPTIIGDYTIAQSLILSIPKRSDLVKQAVSGYQIPESCCVILDYKHLVVPPPREIPTPFLDARKKVIIPTQNKIQKVWEERAEWASAQKTHRASEISKLQIEASRLISWSACCGVKILYIYESNGIAWNDISKIAQMIEVEMKSLYGIDNSMRPCIKIINASTDEIRVISDDEIFVPSSAYSTEKNTNSTTKTIYRLETDYNNVNTNSKGNNTEKDESKETKNEEKKEDNQKEQPEGPFGYLQTNVIPIVGVDSKMTEGANQNMNGTSTVFESLTKQLPESIPYSNSIEQPESLISDLATNNGTFEELQVMFIAKKNGKESITENFKKKLFQAKGKLNEETMNDIIEKFDITPKLVLHPARSRIHTNGIYGLPFYFFSDSESDENNIDYDPLFFGTESPVSFYFFLRALKYYTSYYKSV
ncbi:unnamed protein product [[Candida] boidinii]|uniref:Unnamed protein product n=1 Tax=Candida boidinii TaxID=5477 RepID=A0A9W6WF27_CANBO|nr:unnamed protein product [[Candida] boidinii]